MNFLRGGKDYPAVARAKVDEMLKIVGSHPGEFEHFIDDYLRCRYVRKLAELLRGSSCSRKNKAEKDSRGDQSIEIESEA